MKKKLDLITLFVSLIAGCAWWLLGRRLYWLLTGTVPTILVIALYFAGMAVLLLVGCVLSATLRKYTMATRKAFGKAAVILLAIALLAGVFQFLYSLDFSRTPTNHTSYIFLLDDSGSMSTNDPKNERAKAVQKVMASQDPDFPFAVYSFSDGCSQLVPMTDASRAGSVQILLQTYGQTYMASAINTILDDLEDGSLDGGKHPRIILLSDGIDMDLSSTINKALKRASGDNVSISTVGFGSADERYLKRIANETDGVYVPVLQIDELENAMRIAAVTSNDVERTLIGCRDMPRLSWLYGLLRCVFLVILGVGFFLIKGLLMRTNDRDSNLIVANLVPTLAGALATELLANSLRLGESAAQAALCGFFCLLLTTRVQGIDRRTDGRAYRFGKDGEPPEGEDEYDYGYEDEGRKEKKAGPEEDQYQYEYDYTDGDADDYTDDYGDTDDWN